jgi:Rrf2 family protein
MLKLSKKTDYGLMAINYIATHQTDGHTVNTREIAGTYNIPVELLAKILQTLAKRGLITSLNGPKGGYVLTRDPSTISVAEVLMAIEGPIGIAECYQSRDSQCRQMDTCSIRDPVEKIQRRITKLLDTMTLAEMNS